MAASTLACLVDAEHDVVGVVSKPEKRRGRRELKSDNPVVALAKKLGIHTYFNPIDILGIDFDIGVVVAYGKLIPQEVLEYRRLLNIHFSLLPRWRGAAPVERALLEGDTETGVCIMEVVQELDAGGVFDSQSLVIGEYETAAQLTERLVEIGNVRLLKCLADPSIKTVEPVQQSGEITWAAKITSEDLHIRWESSPTKILRQLSVGKPWTFYGSRRVLIRSASKVELLATSELSSRNPSGLQGQDSSPNPSGLQGQDSSPNPSPTLPQPPGTIEIASIGGSKALVVHAGGGLLKVDRLQPEGKAEIDGLAWANGVNLQSIPCFTFT